ncbi:MAG: hypothetical protein H7338_15965, partial [Candidatus Sericytochromatia bacterium]|nr:hypothetical protein [Candidatus Sericytochromatia bacterium]
MLQPVRASAIALSLLIGLSACQAVTTPGPGQNTPASSTSPRPLPVNAHAPTVTTLVTGGTDAARAIDRPMGMAIDTAGTLYVADFGLHRISKVTAAGVVTTIAGSSQGYADGKADVAKFANPAGLAIDGAGTLY